MEEMVSPERALEIVLAHISLGPTEQVDLLDAVGRVSAQDLRSDIDVAPFAHSCMDGYALHARELETACPERPVKLRVVAEEPAGSCYDGELAPGECIRIMTGAVLPECADSVVKYELVTVVEGDGKTGSIVSFNQSTRLRSNVREAGEDAKKGEIVVKAGERIGCAGIGFLAGCGITRLSTYVRPRVAILATGSELVDPDSVPTPGKIRNSNGHAMAACIVRAGAIPVFYPIVKDTQDALREMVQRAVDECDFVLTTGGAANGDYDFIKQVITELGELYLTTVNMRPGKAQAFGLVKGVPVFGLPGNPAAAYIGFEALIRPALRKMQGFTSFKRQHVKARLLREVAKPDPRRLYLRSVLSKDEQGGLQVLPFDNQSSGLFATLQRSNCLAIMPEGREGKQAGDIIDCVLLDIPEEMVL